MDAAIQGFVSVMLAVVGGECVLHRETGQKPFLNLKSSGACTQAVLQHLDS
jgi:hypothetical protein